MNMVKTAANNVVDPIRDNRPTYHPGDPIIRFHYAVIRPNHTRLGRHGADMGEMWAALRPTFGSNVVGPTFEPMARHWLTHYTGHLTRLESARSAPGRRAAEAVLYLVGRGFTGSLVSAAAGRSDVELIDLERLYFGS